MQFNLTPIQQTLLQLLRRQDSSRILRTPVDLNTVDWEEFLTEAGHQDVIPLLHYRLQSKPELKAAIPAQILEHIGNTFLKNKAYISLFYRELQQILSACEQEGIPVILLKGAYLAKQVYPEMGLRPMGDMDLMVHPRDLPRACAITEKFGYTTSYAHSAEVEMAFSHDMPMYSKGNIFGIEWHWHIADPGSPYDIELNELWERAIPMQIEGIPCFGLAPEDLFLHLAFHLTGHHICLVPLRFLADIDMLLGADSLHLNWQVIVERARRWRLERCVYLTLRLANECFATPQPERVLTALVPERVEDNVMAWAYEQLFTVPVPKSRRITLSLVDVWHEQNIMKRFSMVWEKVFLSQQELSRNVGVHPDTPALWRYYPLRVWILIRRYGRQILRIWRKDKDQLVVLNQHSNMNDLERWLSG
jgi:hypothetical protein